MFCHNCGKEIDDNAKFCKHCGAQVSSESSAQTPARQNSDSATIPSTQNTQHQGSNTKSEKPIYCPQCGSRNVQTIVLTDTQTTGKNFSVGQGCCGWILFGPLGLLCGSCGQKQKMTTTNTTVLHCNSCGHQFHWREEYRQKIIAAETTADRIMPITIISWIIAMIIEAVSLFRETNIERKYVLLIFLLMAVVSLLVLLFMGAIAESALKKECDQIRAELNAFDDAQKKYGEKD